MPDITTPERWSGLAQARAAAGDKYILATGVSLYERVHFIRGLENAWTDIYIARDELCRLIDILVDMNVARTLFIHRAFPSQFSPARHVVVAHKQSRIAGQCQYALNRVV